MSKGMESRKEAKKKPQKSADEKRAAKRDKKSAGGNTLLGSHSTS
ncbi:hypothetical protein [Aquipseudomonas campi]